LSVLVEEMKTTEMVGALQASDGLCLPHLRQALEHVRKRSTSEKLLAIHREKLESLSAELAEFIRKNDYRVIQKGFGKEGDAWLRAITLMVGNRKRA
jgi:DNA-binding transcriptional MerR regulator